MAEVLRSWGCQNCGQRFDAWEANPACPGCGCVRVSWVPAGGHVGGAQTRTADAELRALADCFKMGDMNSARRGEAAKIVRAQPTVNQHQQAIQFAPGFAAVAHPNQAVCVPSSQPVTYRAKATVGAPLSPNAAVPGIARNTVIEARHTGRSAA